METNSIYHTDQLFAAFISERQKNRHHAENQRSIENLMATVNKLSKDKEELFGKVEILEEKLGVQEQKHSDKEKERANTLKVLKKENENMKQSFKTLTERFLGIEEALKIQRFDDPIRGLVKLSHQEEAKCKRLNANKEDVHKDKQNVPQQLSKFQVIWWYLCALEYLCFVSCLVCVVGFCGRAIADLLHVKLSEQYPFHLFFFLIFFCICLVSMLISVLYCLYILLLERKMEKVNKDKLWYLGHWYITLFLVCGAIISCWLSCFAKWVKTDSSTAVFFVYVATCLLRCSYVLGRRWH